MAKLHTLNAITRSPGDFAAVKAYVELVLNDGSLDELDHAMGVVETAAYHVQPEQIEATVALRDQLSDRHSALLAEMAKKRIATDWTAKVDALERADVDALLENEDSFDEHLDELNDVKASLSGLSDQASKALCDRIQHSIERCLNSQAARRTIDYLDQCRQRLHNESDPRSERAASVASAAEASLAQLWGIPENDLAPGVRKAVNAQADSLRAEIDRILLARSQDVLLQVKGCADAAEGNPPVNKAGDSEKKVGPVTARLRWIQHQAQTAAQYASVLPERINGNESKELKDAFEKIQKQEERITQSFQKSQQDQYDAYQKWAIGVIKSAMAQNEAVSWTARHVNPLGDSNDKVASDIYIDTDFVKIDPNLLSSEVATVYSDVRGRLFSHMDAGTLVDLAGKTNEQKHPLEDF